MMTSAQVVERQSPLPTNVRLGTKLTRKIRLYHHEFYTIALVIFDIGLCSLISTAPLGTIQYSVFKAIPVLLLLLSCLLSLSGQWSTRLSRLY